MSTGTAPATIASSSVKRCLGAIGRFSRGVGEVTAWAWGFVCLILGLSLLATLPGLQFLSLGYLLAAGGRVARSGRLRDGLTGIEEARRIGTALLGTWLVLWPLRWVSDLAVSAELINGAHPSAERWRLAAWGLLPLTLAHIFWAHARGGRLRDFAWPAPRRLWKRVRQGHVVQQASAKFWQRIQRLQVAKHLRLGCLGGLAALTWLSPPITLLVLAAQASGAGGLALGLLGAFFLSWVVCYVPYMQARFAATGDWRALWDRRTVRQHWRQAPLAHLLALSLLLMMAMPLYLLKAELIPREAAWLPSILFVTSMLPAKILIGRAAYAGEHHGLAWAPWRWLATLLVIPVAAIYVAVVYATQYTSWYGLASLYEQHAFFLPVPFVNW